MKFFCRFVFASVYVVLKTMYDDEEELKARIEAAEKDLGFFSLYWDDIRETDWISDEELEESVNDALDDLIDAKRKLKESGSPP